MLKPIPSKKRVPALVVFCLLLLQASALLAAGPPASAGGEAVRGGQKSADMKFTITGKIAKSENGYVVQGQRPLEIFTILNANPKVLDKLVKSGRSVTVEAVSVMGDNIEIRKIDGKTYKETKPGKGQKQ